MKRASLLVACLAISAVGVGSPLADSVSGPTLTLDESSAYEAVSGSTLYYDPSGSNSGSFTVTATASAGQARQHRLSGRVRLRLEHRHDADVAVLEELQLECRRERQRYEDGHGDRRRRRYGDRPVHGHAGHADGLERHTDREQRRNRSVLELVHEHALVPACRRRVVHPERDRDPTPTPASPRSPFPDVSGRRRLAGLDRRHRHLSPYPPRSTYTWTAGAASPGPQQVTATNGIGVTGTHTITIGADSTPPTGSDGRPRRRSLVRDHVRPAHARPGH